MEFSKAGDSLLYLESNTNRCIL